MLLHRYLLRILLLVFIVTSVFFFVITTVTAQVSPAKEAKKTLQAIEHKPFKSVCDHPVGHKASCHAKVTTQANGITPLTSLSPLPGSLTPRAFHTAYQLPCTPGGVVSGTCSNPNSFLPIIAIVDAYHSPTIENDLLVYSNYFGIPTCSKANGCLRVVNESGGNTLPLTVNSGWALETSLDVEVAHAICQTCQILLVETSSNTYTSLAKGVGTAANLGAVAISNSYGGSEWSGPTSYDSFYTHPGVAVTASSGDSGYGVSYPASSSNVIAVGGTTLSLFTDFSYAGESVWSGAGSGCSGYEGAQSWQLLLPNWQQSQCGTKRGVADIAADADPNTGAAVYDSTSYNGQIGWWQIGGTSLSSPIIASIFALSYTASSPDPRHLLYDNAGLFHDITSGKNGACIGSMCIGVVGYDGPTGLGTPNGLAGFSLSSITNTPTPTPTLYPNPTATPSPTLTPSPSSTPTPTPSGDTTPPVVSITNPLDGNLVTHSHTYTIRATATDNKAVKQVSFYVNGQFLSSDTQSVYKASWLVPSAKGIKYQLSAVAEDTSGNTTTATIQVTSR